MRRALAVLGALLVAGCSTASRAERLDRQGTKEKRPDKAVTLFSEAIELEPDRADFRIHRGDARMKQEDWDGAIADYGEALRLKPSGRTHLLRARARRMKGVYDLALADASAAVELDPELEAAAETERSRIRKAMSDRARRDRQE